MPGRVLKYILVIVIPAIMLAACGPAPQEKTVPEMTVKNNVYLEGENVGGLKESQLAKKINEMASGIDLEKKNASLDGSSWQLAETEQAGKKVNVEKTLRDVLASEEGDRKKLQVEEVAPDVTSGELLGNIVRLGRFSTPLYDRQSSRLNNIDIASDRLNGKIVKPGAEFSFNMSIGRRTQDKGYEWAPIIKKTPEGYKKGFGVGGGVCQLATTLYNAVDMAGLPVIERHEHSKDVNYVPDGRDATVSYGSVDFKFKNDRMHPVMIKVDRSKRNLTVSILENRNE